MLYLPLWSPGLRGSAFKSIDPFRHECAVTGAIQVANGRLFDGDDYLRIPNHSSFSVLTAISVLVWVKGAAQDDKAFIVVWDDNQREFNVSTGAGGNTNKPRIFVHKTGNNDLRKDYTSSLVAFDGSWHLVGFSFNTSTDVLSIYVDDELDTSPTLTQNNTIDSIFASSADLLVGARLSAGNPAGYITGEIGEAWIYNRALTPEEISYLYRLTKGRYL